MFCTCTTDPAGGVSWQAYGTEPASLQPGEVACSEADFAMARAAFQAPPDTAGTVSSLAFLDLFTPAEQVGVFTAALREPALLGLLFQVACSGNMQLDDPRVSAGLGLLAASGLIAPTRPAQVLGAAAPAAADHVAFDLSRATESEPIRADAVRFDVARAVESGPVRADAVAFEVAGAVEV